MRKGQTEIDPESWWRIYRNGQVALITLSVFCSLLTIFALVKFGSQGTLAPVAAIALSVTLLILPWHIRRQIRKFAEQNSLDFKAAVIRYYSAPGDRPANKKGRWVTALLLLGGGTFVRFIEPDFFRHHYDLLKLYLVSPIAILFGVISLLVLLRESYRSEKFSK